MTSEVVKKAKSGSKRIPKKYESKNKEVEEMRELQNVKANVERLLGMSEPQAEKEERDYGQR